MCLTIQIRKNFIFSLRIKKIIDEYDSFVGSSKDYEQLYRSNEKLNKLLSVQVAQEDIICYKVLELVNSEYYSPYRHLKYIFNQIINSDLPIRVDNALVVRKGFPFYPIYLDINHGIHGFIALPLLSENYFGFGSHALFKAIIPKGTKYIAATNNEIIAEKMYITDEFICNIL